MEKGDTLMPVNGSGRFIGPGQPIRDGLVGWYDTRYKRDSLSDDR